MAVVRCATCGAEKEQGSWGCPEGWYRLYFTLIDKSDGAKVVCSQACALPLVSEPEQLGYPVSYGDSGGDS